MNETDVEFAGRERDDNSLLADEKSLVKWDFVPFADFFLRRPAFRW